MIGGIRFVPLTLPNILSLYRLMSFPFILILIFTGKYNLYVFFMWLNLTTDILDGWIARKLNQVTETGAMLDGLADTATYILGLTGIFMFKWIDFKPFIVSFIVFLAMFLISRFFSFIKLGRFYGFQTYGGKITGYIHGSFLLVLFLFGFYTWFYWIMVISGYLVFSENILITVALKESKSQVKGLYWILKEQNRSKK